MWKFNVWDCCERDEGEEKEEKLEVYENENYFHTMEFPAFIPYLKREFSALSQLTCIFAHISAKHITNHKLYDITHISLIKPMRCAFMWCNSHHHHHCCHHRDYHILSFFWGHTEKKKEKLISRENFNTPHDVLIHDAHFNHRTLMTLTTTTNNSRKTITIISCLIS
jgi:hypothetical protein